MATTMAAAESEEKKGGSLSSCCEGGGGGQRGTFCLLLTQLKWTEIGAIVVLERGGLVGGRARCKCAHSPPLFQGDARRGGGAATSSSLSRDPP